MSATDIADLQQLATLAYALDQADHQLGQMHEALFAYITKKTAEIDALTARVTAAEAATTALTVRVAALEPPP